MIKNCEKSEEKHKWENIFNYSLEKIATLRHRRLNRLASDIPVLGWMSNINESSQKLNIKKFKKIMAKILLANFKNLEITNKSGL